ncbi:hypothetical protein UK23_38225 [Lentzea aerocolonigenes]|uniref:HTH luxR-type domain-containing protein n=1 Tax=Lentzea aerocolonigenes TaxID=68170 RepID=A0A0F0GF60_LENAE|nr:LuxR C-terminal-related transcriptional regulator [Lentzea aerocolonigenes]KJK42209.1 hypothetical protein UK23_38225 [Lentzea aerocolonigenes]
MAESGQVRIACFGTASLYTEGVATAVTAAGAWWCGVVPNAGEVFQLVARSAVDVLLVELASDPGLYVCEVLEHTAPSLVLVVLHETTQPPPGLEVPGGVRALLSLRAARSELAILLRDIVPGAAPPLSAREIQVLGLIARGYSTERIASTLRVGAETIRTHVKHVFVKLGALNRPHAVALGCARGLISAPEWDAVPGG